MTTFQRFVLYVAQDHSDPSLFCQGSRQAVRLIESMKEDVNIQNLDVLLEKGVSIPEWLRGSPTLVDMNSKNSYEGSECLEYLTSLVEGGGGGGGADDFEGLSADGGHVSFEQHEPSQSQGAETIGEGKITEADLERYMQLRNQGQPSDSGNRVG